MNTNDLAIDQSLLIKAIDQTGVGVVISDPKTKDNPLIYVNKGFEAITTGYTKEEILGKNCRVLQGCHRNQPALDEVRRAIKEEKSCEAELLNFRKNGEEFWNELTITPIFNAEGKLDYFIGIQRDVTVRKKAEETMRLYEKVFLNTLQGVIITDAVANIILVNEAFTDTTGYSSQEVLGKNPNILSSGKHGNPFYSELWKELREKGQWKGEVWNKRKNGEIYPEFLNISEVRDLNGQVINYVAIFADITESKTRELQLAELSIQDALTGIANRRRFDQYLIETWNMLLSSRKPISLILLDVDFFKKYNDTYGHQAGDRCLMEVANIIEEAVDSKVDLAARYGGEEFAVILQSDRNRAKRMAEKIRINIEKMGIPHTCSDVSDVVTVSLGVMTAIPSQNTDISVLISQADQALYKAKEQGRNRVGEY